MAQIIDFNEIQRARRRPRAFVHDRQALERAAQVFRESLAHTAALLPDAQRNQRVELLDRIDRLSAMLRYAMRMLGESDEPGLDGTFRRSNHPAPR